MARSLASNFYNFLGRLENMLPQIFHGKNEFSMNYALGCEPCTKVSPNSSPSAERRDRFSLKELLGDGMLWAVPKHRRTVEKRLQRKFGVPGLNWKPLEAKANLRTCNQCGSDYEVGMLCPKCYEKVQKETRLMQDTIQEELGLEPIDQEVVVIYDGEKTADQLGETKPPRVVEMKKPRPVWFSKNLMQKSTSPAINSKDVEPSKLG